MPPSILLLWRLLVMAPSPPFSWAVCIQYSKYGPKIWPPHGGPPLLAHRCDNLPLLCVLLMHASFGKQPVRGVPLCCHCPLHGKRPLPCVSPYISGVVAVYQSKIRLRT